MKHLLALSLSLSSRAQKEIKLEEIAAHIGDSITVKGRIHGVRYLETANNTPTFINVVAAYPNQLLTQKTTFFFKKRKEPFVETEGSND